MEEDGYGHYSPPTLSFSVFKASTLVRRLLETYPLWQRYHDKLLANTLEVQNQQAVAASFVQTLDRDYHISGGSYLKVGCFSASSRVEATLEEPDRVSLALKHMSYPNALKVLDFMKTLH
jgi:hypothetical protein